MQVGLRRDIVLQEGEDGAFVFLGAWRKVWSVKGVWWVEVDQAGHLPTMYGTRAIAPDSIGISGDNGKKSSFGSGRGR